MASNITLSASVRQNLLSLQSTAQMMSLTQNRLATGKKVNSALDNPGNFFTSQSLSNRASDLNNLLDSIGQAQQTLKAADQGITSLTKLVESAKSIAKQAQQAPQASATAYQAFTVTGNPTDEVMGTTTGSGAVTVANAATYSFDLTVGGINGPVTKHISYTSDANATADEIIAGINTAIDTELTGTDYEGLVVASEDGTSDTIKIDVSNADVDFQIVNATANTNLTDGTYNSTSLLDNIGAPGDGGTLKIQVNGGTEHEITFGTGAGQVSTLAELNTALGNVRTAVGNTILTAATANATALTLTVASGSSQNSLKLTSSDASIRTALGISDGTTQGSATTGSGTSATRASLEADYTNVLSQITALANDASYNGINLLKGDDLKVVFNEGGTSFLNISGVDFAADADLGLSTPASGDFQINGNLDSLITELDAALATLRTQSSKFGSNLTTVQTRQDFTKNMINTLQTGADNLVLADTNEEGANLLALQTRQQLSTTALSLSAQADQAVMRLF